MEGRDLSQSWKQESLFASQEDEDEFSCDDWETPGSVASAIGLLVKPSDRIILEPCAGRGQIFRHLPHDRLLIANEIKANRFAELRQLYDEASEEDVWHFRQGDFLGNSEWIGHIDLVVTNPPFSLWAEFLKHAIACLNPKNPEARVLFLLPGDFSNSVGNAKALRSIDCHISHRYKIVGRVGYLKEGQQFKQRQIYDCLFEFKPGRKDAGESFLCFANP